MKKLSSFFSLFRRNPVLTQEERDAINRKIDTLLKQGTVTTTVPSIRRSLSPKQTSPWEEELRYTKMKSLIRKGFNPSAVQEALGLSDATYMRFAKRLADDDTQGR